jgi:hypothetical protein
MKNTHFEHQHKVKHLDESVSNIGGRMGGRMGGGMRGGFHRGGGRYPRGGYYGGYGYNPYAIWAYPTTAYYIDSENQGDSRIIEISKKGKEALANFRKNKVVNSYFYFLSAIENGGKYNEGALRNKLNLSDWVGLTDRLQLNGLIKIS